MSSASLESLLARIEPEMRAFRRDLHRHPELAYAEHRTAAKVAERLRELPGWEVETGIAETGVVATLGRDLPGPAVALRADMDALPIEEQTGLPHASQVPGMMHACGHDGHTAMLLGAAIALSHLRAELAGPVRLLFQPAEEGGAGGQRMVEAGVLENPSIAAVFGVHNMPFRRSRVGQLCLCPGAAMAGTATFDITVHGRGGHAAAPHVAIDPIYLGSTLVNALQGIVARRTDPVGSAVVTVTKFHAGTAYNVIPGEARLSGTIRALDDEVMAQTSDLVRTQSEGLIAALGGRAEVTITPGYPVLRNHPQTDEYLRTVIRELGREADYLEVDPIMGGEDFAYFAQKVPSTFWFLASRPADQAEVPFCHHPEFDFNDEVLADGIRMHLELARRFARTWRN
ncbi:MAG: M20 family metallopeptidase [Opitutales bacterium]